MATSFTLSDILTDAAALANSPAFSSSTRVTSTLATYWLSQGVRALCGLVRQYLPNDRDFIQTADLTTTAGATPVSLPTDCGEVHAVIWQRGTQDYVLLASAQQDDLAVRLDAGQTWEGAGISPTYRVDGNTVSIYPAGASVETVTIYYTTHLSSGGATVTMRIDSDRWLALYVAELVATSKSMPSKAAELRQKMSLIENDLLNRTRERDANVTHTIRDVRTEALAQYMRQRWV